MDGQEPIEIDWESIKKQIDEYDSGNINVDSLHAKTLEVAYNEGYAHCMADQEEAHANLLIMLSTPSGNA